MLRNLRETSCAAMLNPDIEYIYISMKGWDFSHNKNCPGGPKRSFSFSTIMDTMWWTSGWAEEKEKRRGSVCVYVFQRAHIRTKTAVSLDNLERLKHTGETVINDRETVTGWTWDVCSWKQHKLQPPFHLLLPDFNIIKGNNGVFFSFFRAVI